MVSQNGCAEAGGAVSGHAMAMMFVPMRAGSRSDVAKAGYFAKYLCEKGAELSKGSRNQLKFYCKGQRMNVVAVRILA
jgi:hypothetical protein